MDIYGVITGDIVSSTKVDPDLRDGMLDAIDGAIAEINKMTSPDNHITGEIFRGDSFQIVVPRAWDTLRVGLLMRFVLKRTNMENSMFDRKGKPLYRPGERDARISVGIGSINYHKDRVAVSDGEAFHNSGRRFDAMGRSSRMVVATPWGDVNEEMKTLCVLADHIVGRMTARQSWFAALYLLRGVTQKELAAEMGISPQLISKSLSYGGGVMKDFVRRFETLVKGHVG